MAKGDRQEMRLETQPGQGGESTVSRAGEWGLDLKGHRRAEKGFPGGKWWVGCYILETVHSEGSSHPPAFMLPLL